MQAARRPAFVRRFHAWVTALGGEIRDVSYQRSTGGRGTAFSATVARPARGLIVVAHATGNDRYFPLLHTYRALLSAGWQVFAFDADGHGRESTHVLDPAAVDSMVAEAAAAAMADAPGLPLYLLGQSLGALLVLRYLQQGGRAEGAVLLSPPLSGRIADRHPLKQEASSVLKTSWWKALPIYGPWGILPAIGAFRRTDYPLRLKPPLSGARVADYVGIVDRLVERFAPVAHQSTVRCPCLFLYGSADTLTPPAQGQAVASDLEPPSRFQVIPGETHYTLPLSQACQAEIRQWLSAIAGASP